MPTVIVYRGHNEQWRWRLVDDNGDMIEQSELLPSLEDAEKAGRDIAAKNETDDVDIRLPEDMQPKADDFEEK